MRKSLRTITIDELDQGYRVTTDIRSGLGEIDLDEKVRLELAVLDLGKVLKLVKTYLGSDLEEPVILKAKEKNV